MASTKLSSSWMNLRALHIFEHRNVTIMAEADFEGDYEELVSLLAYLYRWINAIGEDLGNSSFLE